MEIENKGGVLLPHHEQESLCTTRLPYRQGRKLTAVKVYSVNSESNHLLVFGVPSLNLRQEAKALFSKFGKLLQFNMSKEHVAEVFTETYHAMFEKIQSARLAKRMLDTKNFYGGSLHVCYAPELEDINETRKKLLQRQKDVIFRLRNLQKDTSVKVPETVNNVTECPVSIKSDASKLNMGDINTIDFKKKTLKRKKHQGIIAKEKRFKPCFLSNSSKTNDCMNRSSDNNDRQSSMLTNNDFRLTDRSIEIVDCTSTNLDTVTNINESFNYDHLENLHSEQTSESNLNDHLNYNHFGNEVIRKVPVKSVNKIKFNLNNKR